MLLLIFVFFSLIVFSFYLNTSNVTVNQWRYQEMLSILYNLNTSNVTVNRF